MDRMNFRRIGDNWTRLIYRLSQNTISLIGVVLTTSSAVTLIAFWIYDFVLPGPSHPYVGILLFLVLPALFILGLLLIPIGILAQRRRSSASAESAENVQPETLQRSKVRTVLSFVAVATFLNILIFTFASYKGVAYMDSKSFCGQTCHTVMSPEYSAYQNSAHSKVECVECHIGPGAGWFVRAKVSGVRQVIAVTFNTYERPIPSPVKNLRQARDTCGHCHWAERFSGDKLILKTSYSDDEKNTPLTTALVMKIGGRTAAGSVGTHGKHVDDGSQIRYVSTDERRQVIPLVYYTNDKGETREYFSEDSKVSKQELEIGEKRVMDCIDCHNRPTHAFELPESAVDLRMSRGLISPELPYIHKKAVDLLKANYADRQNAQKQIVEGLESYYRSTYAEIYNSKRAQVEESAESVANIYLRNIFPQMNMTWGVHPNNLGHNDFPGCFRCHDGSHVSADGAVISNDCTTCHTLVADREENPKALTDLGMSPNQ
jgi:uncharacterized membrane protein